MRATLPRGLLRRLATQPSDAVAVATSTWALRRRNWWRRAPYLPVPDDAYWNFRMKTALGDVDAQLTTDDVIDAARWSRRERRRR